MDLEFVYAPRTTMLLRLRNYGFPSSSLLSFLAIIIIILGIFMIRFVKGSIRILTTA